MKFREPQQPDAPAPAPPDNSSEFRVFAAWMGLVIVAFGLAISGYLLLKIGQVLLDPRGFETQVDRWEFVVRGRTTDAFPDAYETPDRQIIRNPDAAAASAAPEKQPEKSRSEEVADLAGRIGSKSARPVALFLIVLVLTLMVRIAIGIIHAGIRLAYITAGERDYMKRILEELLDQRQNRE